MKLFPIIPIWLISIISIILLDRILSSKKTRLTLYEIGLIIIIFIMNLRISIPIKNADVLTNDVDVLFVVDNTLSMYAVDYDSYTKSRMDAVKEDCSYIIRKLNGARYSLITFNNTSKLALPYTYDSDITKESIEVLQPLKEYYARGSSLNTPLKDTTDFLKRTFNDEENRKKIIFFISDGEITDDSKLESFSSIKEYIDDGAVLGYGTTKGGNIKTIDDFTGEETYLEDNSTWPYKKAVSKIDESNLKKIAKDIDIDYIKMNKQTDIDSKIKEILTSSKSKTSNIDRTSYKDTYYYFIIPLFILLFLVYIEYKRRTL